MLRLVLFLALMLFAPASVFAQEAVLMKDEGPPIAITSPDVGTTYVYGSLKSRQLYWNKRAKMLIARVTYTDSEMVDNNSPQDDTMDFHLPGVAFDETRGIFTATTAKGVVIPIAHLKKSFFVKTIEILPNARVRVIRDHGNVTVVLEAISPDDPAMHPAPTNPDGTHSVDFSHMLN